MPAVRASKRENTEALRPATTSRVGSRIEYPQEPARYLQVDMNQASYLLFVLTWTMKDLERGQWAARDSHHVLAHHVYVTLSPQGHR